jgi:hypothetical protein
MFRHRQRRPAPFADFINWTDYHWEPSAWQGATGPRAWPRPAGPQRRYSLLQVFLAGLAVVAGLKLMTSLKNRRNRSWVERGVLAILLVLVASYVSKRKPL